VLVGTREAAVKYHSRTVLCLMTGREPAGRQGQAGSLTGAVASQRVTEAPKGSLRVDGHHPRECKGRRELDCETDRSSRDESRA
jgi:Family of unknown function (DUF6467)